MIFQFPFKRPKSKIEEGVFGALKNHGKISTEILA
jgi:hypothetical protein